METAAKQGVKTTEFWLTVGQWLGSGGVVLGLPEEHWAVKAASIASSLILNAVYIWSRTKIKA